MNNIIKVKELCEQELYFLYNYIDFCKNRSLFFAEDVKANSLILEFSQHKMNALNIVKKKREYLSKINKYISENCEKVVFLAWGAFAHKKMENVNKDKHVMIVSSHPSPLSYTKTYKVYPPFKGSRPFSKINCNLEKKIEW